MATSDMELQRKQDISLLYWLEDLFEDAPFVTIVSEYKPTELVAPCIAVETGDTEGDVYELGNRTILMEREFYLGIYAKNISQRNDYAYKVFNNLYENAIPVYNYDEGFPPDVSPTQIGNLLFKRARISPLGIDPELVDKLYYQSLVKYTAIYENRS